jgi:Holliday junction DNA helicase RuvA
MIAHIRGKLLLKKASFVVIEAAGVGYGVSIPVSSFYEIGDIGTETALHIYTHIREDALALFGFRTETEKGLFEKLIGVSGVGPKLAITILSGLEPTDLIQAIQRSNVDRLVHIPGVGKKTAERLILELKDKLAALLSDVTPSIPSSFEEHFSPQEDDVVSALVNLGYQRPAAENALKDAKAENPDGDFEKLLRSSLRALAKKFFK